MLCMWRRSCLGDVMVSSPIWWNPALTCSCPPTQSVPTPAIIDHFDVAAPYQSSSVVLQDLCVAEHCPILPRPPFMPASLPGGKQVGPASSNECLSCRRLGQPRKPPAQPRGHTWGHGQGKEAVSVKIIRASCNKIFHFWVFPSFFFSLITILQCQNSKIQSSSIMIQPPKNVLWLCLLWNGKKNPKWSRETIKHKIIIHHIAWPSSV